MQLDAAASEARQDRDRAQRDKDAVLAAARDEREQAAARWLADRERLVADKEAATTALAEREQATARLQVRLLSCGFGVVFRLLMRMRDANGCASSDHSPRPVFS